MKSNYVSIEILLHIYISIITEIRELRKWSLTNKINETLLTDEQEIAPVGLSVRMWVPKTCVSQVFTREI